MPASMSVANVRWSGASQLKHPCNIAASPNPTTASMGARLFVRKAITRKYETIPDRTACPKTEDSDLSKALEMTD